MAGETTITVIGNLTSDPELRYTAQSVPVASFTVASTPRSYNRATGAWEDGTAMFLRCSAWREMAENINETLSKGMRVIVTGRLVQRNWERDGQNRSSLEIQVDEIGPSLRYASAQVSRNPRNPNGNFGGSATTGGYGNEMGPMEPAGNAGYGAAPAAGGMSDPWATDTRDSSFDAPPPF